MYGQVETRTMQNNFKHIEMKAHDSPVENIEWQGETIETPTTPLVSDDTGKPIIMRVFLFITYLKYVV